MRAPRALTTAREPTRGGIEPSAHTTSAVEDADASELQRWAEECAHACLRAPSTAARSFRAAPVTDFWRTFGAAARRVALAVLSKTLPRRAVSALPELLTEAVARAESQVRGRGGGRVDAQVPQEHDCGEPNDGDRHDDGALLAAAAARVACAVVMATPSALSELASADDDASAQIGTQIRAASAKLAAGHALALPALAQITADAAPGLLALADALRARRATSDDDDDDVHESSSSSDVEAAFDGVPRVRRRLWCCALWHCECRAQAACRAAAEFEVLERAALHLYSAACGGVQFPCLRALACWLAQRELWIDLALVPRALQRGESERLSEPLSAPLSEPPSAPLSEPPSALPPGPLRAFFARGGIRDDGATDSHHDVSAAARAHDSRPREGEREGAGSPSAPSRRFLFYSEYKALCHQANLAERRESQWATGRGTDVFTSSVVVTRPAASASRSWR